MGIDIIDIIADTLMDILKLLPFLFLTYLIMEYAEHRAGGKMEEAIKRSGRFGPAIGSLLGAFPQCGFSAAASNFYAGRMITLGTLIAVFISTSDEMLPILISRQADIHVILKIILLKAAIGMAAGLIVDGIFRKSFYQEENHSEQHSVEHFCESESCNCKEEGIIKSAVKHTIKIVFFIVVISFVLNLAIAYVGEDALMRILSDKPVIGPVIAGIVGLIPNCAASIVLTELYLEGILGLGSLMAGLSVGAGVGLLILFRVNHNLKENLKITGLLYGIGVFAGILIEFIIS